MNERGYRADPGKCVTRTAATSFDVSSLDAKSGLSWRCLPDTVDPRGVKGDGDKALETVAGREVCVTLGPPALRPVF